MTSPPYTTVSLAKRWGCFFRHKWTPWTEPVECTVKYFVLGKERGQGIAAYQSRTCVICNKVEKREVQ